jgi:hypothetical protein
VAEETESYRADGEPGEDRTGDAFVTWFGIWLLPVAGKTPNSAIEEVLGNMIRTLFRDILKDDLLRYSRRGSPGLLEVQLAGKIPQGGEVVAGGEVVDQR